MEMVALHDAMQPMALVVGSHGRRRTPRAALGRVADWLLRRSQAPVLVSHYLHGPAIAAARIAIARTIFFIGSPPSRCGGPFLDCSTPPT
jgi:hypothetical protein